MLGNNQVDLRYAPSGKIIGRFILKADKRPWALIEYLEPKVLDHEPNAVLQHIKRTALSGKSGGYAHWKVIWRYEKFEFQSRNLLESENGEENENDGE